MAQYICDLPTLTLSSSATASNAVGQFDDANALGIYAPATLTNAITLQVAQTTEAAATFVVLQSGGSNVTVAAGTHTTLNKITFRQLRVSSTGGEAQADIFGMTKSVNV